MNNISQRIYAWLDRSVATPFARVMIRELRHQYDGDALNAPLLNKFELRLPAPQNAIDLFAGRWASDLSEVLPGVTSGDSYHFRSDPRPAYALKHFAGPDGSLKGQSILEIGPLEGGHTFALEQFGAEKIISVEANTEAFMKCLIVRNILAMTRTQFVLGDVIEFLRYEGRRFDFIFCSGVLYHMQDPVELLFLMSQKTDRIFLWTHYYGKTAHPDLEPAVVTRHGASFEYFRRQNVGRYEGRFWGGNQPTAALLRREDIFRAFANFGFTEFEIHGEELNHPGGPCFSVSFWRPGHDGAIPPNHGSQ